jgi:hypothetical protein
MGWNSKLNCTSAQFRQRWTMLLLSRVLRYSHLISPGANYATIIQVTTLDSAFAGERIDILKIDVEG